VFGGYRAQEQLGGDTVEHTALGRTPAVSSTMQIDGGTRSGPGRDVRNVGTPGLIGTAGDELSLGQIGRRPCARRRQRTAATDTPREERAKGRCRTARVAES
jgi:hypothetical protein